MSLPAPATDLRYTPTGHDVTLPREELDSRRESFEERGGSIEEHVLRGGSVSITIGQATTYHIPSELAHEWPEVVAISMKLACGEELNKQDKRWIEELAEATGWGINAIIEDLRNLEVDPSERAERYKKLFEEYYQEAQKHKEEGNTRQAGEKIWGATVALMKLCAAVKGIFILHWSRGKLDRFITSNVKPEHRKLFRDLLDKAHRLHEHFYEGDLDEKSFEERWIEVIEFLKKVEKIVLGENKRETV